MRLGRAVATAVSRLGLAYQALRGNVQDPPKWLLELLGGSSRSASGIEVTPTSAMTLSAVYGCVQVLAQTVGHIPLLLYERDGQDKRRAGGHALFRLLHNSPNPEMTTMTWRSAAMAHLGLWGNHYSEIERDQVGRVRALWPLSPNKVKPLRHPASKAIFYQVTLPDGRKTTLDFDSVLHVKGLTLNGLEGLSPIGLARETAGLGLAAQEYGARFFSGGARPGGVLEHPGKLGDKAYERLQKAMEDRHVGLEKAHRLMILEEGMKWSAIGLPPEDAQFLETRKFQVEDVARFYRMPLHKIQSMDRATFGNIEQQAIEFVTDTVMPWLVNFEQEIWLKLLAPGEQLTLFAEFLVNGLLRGDAKSRYETYAIGRQWGWLSANDIRRLENMNGLGPEGDVYLTPLNMAPAGQESPLRFSSWKPRTVLARAASRGPQDEDHGNGHRD